jgi:hypothetical protein
MRKRALLLSGLCLALAAAPACNRNRRPPAQQQGGPAQAGGTSWNLDAQDADDRKDAAEKLRDDGGPPPQAVPALIAALQREPDDEARAEMLITLGASGAPEARPVLEGYLAHSEGDTRKGAKEGLERWSKKNGVARPANPEDIAKLRHPDWEKRQDAADDLGDDDGPGANAIGPLLAAASVERHPKALGAMLITLGKSGVPEAKPLIDAHVESPDPDLRRYARKGQKNWLAKNGTAVRRDVETGPAAAAAPAAVASAPAPAPDACDQFKGICGADPFDVGRCKTDMKPLSYPQQGAWAECVNASTASCQKAHEACMTKAKSAPK